MSNKFRYYNVAIEGVVKANNKSEALALLLGADIKGEVMQQVAFVDRVTAVEARSQVG